MAKKKDPEITVLTARIDTGLHRRVKSKLAAQGSSFQDLIENAVRQVDTGKAEADKEFTKEGAPTHIPATYNFNVVKERSKQVKAIMDDIVSKLDAATEVDDDDAESGKGQFLRDAAAMHIGNRTSIEDEKRLHELGKKARKGKQLPPKEASGGQG